MLTFKETVEKPRLVIKYDNYADSPRNWCNIGKFITIDSRCDSPDDDSDFIYVVKETAQYAKNTENHIDLIKKMLADDYDEEVIYIVPISKYEHSGISYSIGKSFGFDYSNNGFYIVTKKSLNIFGLTEYNEETLNEYILNELEVYNQYVNGQVYLFELYDNEGYFTDSCGDFYAIDDIKEHLPEEFKDENLNDYLIFG